MKNVYEILNFCNDDFYLEKIRKELKKEKDKLDQYLINNIFSKDRKKIKYFPNNLEKDKIEVKIEYKIEDKIEDKIYNVIDDDIKKFYLMQIKNEIENESLDINLIFEAFDEVLSDLKIIIDIDFDTFCEKKHF